MKIVHKLLLIIALFVVCLGTIVLTSFYWESQKQEYDELNAAILRLSNEVFRANALQRVFLEKGTGKERVSRP